ncbi:methionine ABC transporter permease [Caproicibacter sp. BJN0012]|uniref:methionine ABC transporter permease n=1 Tax=Caproicibacter sp. BJN0012 TaxID=3110227 RepID=UPI002E13F19B
MEKLIEQSLDISSAKLLLAAEQTIYMLFWALLIGTLIGVSLGILLVLTRPGGVLGNRIAFSLLNDLINIVRSVPFIILLVFIMPLTKGIAGTTVGTRAALVPLVFYISPYLARLVESSLLEVDSGIIEAAEAMGASTLQIIWHFLLPEALPSLILTLTTGTIGLLGVTAMAGAIGAGGVGDLALTYGYQQFNTPLMTATVIVLILFVQMIQSVGNHFSKKVRTHK